MDSFEAGQEAGRVLIPILMFMLGAWLAARYFSNKSDEEDEDGRS